MSVYTNKSTYLVICMCIVYITYCKRNYGYQMRVVSKKINDIVILHNIYIKY